MSVFGNLVSQAKKHHNLIPMFFFIALGLSSASLYMLRIALRHPDISWNKKGNSEPWNKLPPNYQYKFLAVDMDYKNLKKDRPDF
uniref:NADH dehydrogenase [ubiquinone] 1 alpha subcomplex subunit 4-like 2 n=1 Tax=Myxine glutinosa TaxID=7769 RepID=UPI00358DF260